MAESGKFCVEGYEISLAEKIGQGSFGVVYKGRNTSTGQLVAAKQCDVISDKAGSDALEEIKNFQNLRTHGHIVKLYDYLYKDKSIWLMLEFCDSGNLEQYYVTNKPSISQGIDLMYQAASGVHYMHSQVNTIIHRDIKPGNLLITTFEGHIIIKVTDFGLSKAVDASTSRSMMLSTKAGTPGFLAPECFMGKKYDKSVDIFALGLVYFSMVNYKPGDDALEPLTAGALRLPIGAQMAQLHQLNIPFPEFIHIDTERDSRAVQDVKKLMRRMVHFSPASRCHSRQVVSALESLGGKSPLNMPSTLPRSYLTSLALPRKGTSVEESKHIEEESSPQSESAVAVGGGDSGLETTVTMATTMPSFTGTPATETTPIPAKTLAATVATTGYSAAMETDSTSTLCLQSSPAPLVSPTPEEGAPDVNISNSKPTPRDDSLGSRDRDKSPSVPRTDAQPGGTHFHKAVDEETNIHVRKAVGVETKTRDPKSADVEPRKRDHGMKDAESFREFISNINPSSGDSASERETRPKSPRENEHRWKSPDRNVPPAMSREEQERADRELALKLSRAPSSRPTIRIGRAGDSDDSDDDNLHRTIMRQLGELGDLTGSLGAVLSTGMDDDSSTDGFEVGDQVYIVNDKDKVEELQRGHGGWVRTMRKYLGQRGMVEKKKHGQVQVLHDDGNKFWYNPKALINIGARSSSEQQGQAIDETTTFAHAIKNKYKRFDVVKLPNDPELLKCLQAGHGEFVEQMINACGMKGVVNRVDIDGDVLVEFINGDDWTVNPELLIREDLSEQQVEPGDMVVVVDGRNNAQTLQESIGKWNHDMTKTLGLSGRVISIDENSIQTDTNGVPYEWHRSLVKLVAKKGELEEVLRLHIERTT